MTLRLLDLNLTVLIEKKMKMQRVTQVKHSKKYLL